MVMVHIFYGDSGSGKSRAAQQLASELKAAHGWDYGHYYRTPFPLAPVLIVDAESKAMGVDMFNSLASSGSPFRRRSPRLFFQQEETQVVQALIVCMHVNGPSPIAREVPVSLVAKVHALQKILGGPSESLEAVASAPPPALRMSDALKETKLPLKVWLTSQLPLPPDLCALVLKAYKAALKAQLVAYLSEVASVVPGLMQATITAL